MKSLITSLIALLLTACGSMAPAPAPDNRTHKGFIPPDKGALIVLLPVTSTSATFAPGEAMMTEQLHRQLVAAGYKTVLLEKANYEQLWRIEGQAVGGLFDPATGAPRPGAYGRAMSNLARLVCAETKCAMILQQRLALRRAKLEGSTGTWDGQRRAIPIVNQGASDWRFSGTANVMSVGLLAVSADGELAFSTHGGASFLHQTNAHESRQEFRRDLFSSDSEIADGVWIALAPLRGADPAAGK